MNKLIRGIVVGVTTVAATLGTWILANALGLSEGSPARVVMLTAVFIVLYWLSGALIRRDWPSHRHRWTPVSKKAVEPDLVLAERLRVHLTEPVILYDQTAFDSRSVEFLGRPGHMIPVSHLPATQTVRLDETFRREYDRARLGYEITTYLCECGESTTAEILNSE